MANVSEIRYFCEKGLPVLDSPEIPLPLRTSLSCATRLSPNFSCLSRPDFAGDQSDENDDEEEEEKGV